MIKRYKYLLMNILFCIIIFGGIFFLIGKVYGAIDKDNIWSTKDKDLPGKIIDGAFSSELTNVGQLTCFWHKEGALPGMNTEIHSVYDISFNNTSNLMQIKSIINDGKNTTKVTTAKDKVKRNIIGNFVAQTSVKNNAFYVQRALYAAITKKVVVNESAVAGEMQWFDTEHNTKNPQKADDYINYQYIKKVKTKPRVRANNTVRYQNEEYQIIGPFKMQYAGKLIDSFTVKIKQAQKSNTVIESTNSDDNIIWVKRDSKNGGWIGKKKNFNAKNEDDKYELNNRKFYLAVKKSMIPEGDKEWTVKAKQQTFSYNRSRIAVCVGNNVQQTGFYVFKHTVDDEITGTITWNLGQQTEDDTCSLRVKKVDANEHEDHKNDTECDCEELEGEFYLWNQTTKKWVNGGTEDAKTEGENPTVYKFGDTIKQLKKNNTYSIYEITAPDEYNIKFQDNYQNNGRVLLKEVELTDTDHVTEIIGTNHKHFTTISGKVWENEPEGKNSTISTLYDSNSSKLLSGITVNLYEGGKKTATTTTNDKGEYSFSKKYFDCNKFEGNGLNTYVEFIYNNKEYITGEVNNSENGSKAKEYSISKVKLDDNKLTGTSGVNYGSARTTPDEGKGLADYYEYDQSKQEYCIKNVNLGLIKKHEPNFSLMQNLECIKVTMKGYEYTYKYAETPVLKSDYVPTVNEQTTAKTFTGKIYPTDIAYNDAKNTDGLKVYAIYSISVGNSETENNNKIYYENKLYLNSLKINYDTDRFDLDKESNKSYVNSGDFNLWSKESEGKASYAVDKGVYKDGIESGTTKTSYIQFRVKNDALIKLLNNNVSDEQLRRAASIATANGYHEYTRTDELWRHDENITAFDGAKGSYQKKISADYEGEKYNYLHKSINKEYSSGALYLGLDLGESRKISGTVFEDTRTESSIANNTNLGNGLLDADEKNRVKNVTVELLDENGNVTDLYRKTENGGTESIQASTTSGNNGTYEFDGVVPGYYYIRFTYGDGNQKIIDVTGKEIPVNSSDYRSTIINTTDAGNIIKNAMDVTNGQLAEAKQALPANQTEAQKKIVEWYKYLNNTNYSTAIDNINKRSELDDCIYTTEDDIKTIAVKGNENINYSTQLIDAQTPVISISIENDTNTSVNMDRTAENQQQKYKYEGFNFGIIEQGKTIIDIDKRITNIRLTTQTGTNLVSADPQSEEAKYITALDKINGGGTKNAKMEIENNLTYGSELAVTYQITLKNSSDYKDYLGEKYYKYGTDGIDEKKITIQEVKDIMDSKYDYNGGKVREILTGGAAGQEIEITKEDDKSLTMTNWTSMKKGETSTITYTAQTLLSSSNNPKYGNNAKVTKFSLDKLTVLHSGFEWKKEDTAFSITAPTGKDKSNKYIIAAGISLSALAIGILTIKRKVLKK